MIKVSVIVPVYKVSLKYLRECFASLLAQTMQECEFIVVSDGAPDAECSVCEEYAAKNPRFRFFRREHAGVSATRNFGIAQAQGEYIAFVDSDDWVESSAFTICYKKAKELNSDILLLDYIEDKHGFCKKITQKPRHLNPDKVLKDILTERIMGAMWSKFVKREFILSHSLSFNEKLNYNEDSLFWAKALQIPVKIHYINEAFYHYNTNNPTSITGDFTSAKYSERKKYISLLKQILPAGAYNYEINTAALMVKVEARFHKIISTFEFHQYEPTKIRTILSSKFSCQYKLFLIFQVIIFKPIKVVLKEIKYDSKKNSFLLAKQRSLPTKNSALY